MNALDHPRAMRAGAGLERGSTRGMARRRFTVAEFDAMAEAGVLAEDERLELVGGEIVRMSPKGARHERIKAALNETWLRAAPPTVWIVPETTFRVSHDTALEPDFVVFARSTPLEGLGGPDALLVVEVADSSLRYELGRKANLYASFGVRELWVVDAAKSLLRVHRDPRDGAYRDIADFDAKTVATPRFAPAALALRLDALDLP